jgi:arabinose-5-phosphate isomerase
MNIIQIAKDGIKKEIGGISLLIDRIGPEFERAVDIILDCKGRVIVTGVGKSGIIGRKIAATLSSTGTPAFFLHPTEAIHGDMGLVIKDDVVITLSKSGRTRELLELLPSLKRLGVIIISLTGTEDSPIVRMSDITLDCSVKEEMAPNILAPTVSTTVMLVMGDALACAILAKRNFKLEDMALLHPGGSIGKKLTTRAEEIMLTGTYVPIVELNTSMKEVILEMTAKRGITTVVDKRGKLSGVITDGDLRRFLEKEGDIFSYRAKDIMTPEPKTAKKGELIINVVKRMQDAGITALPVIDNRKHPIGIIHLHDLMRLGMV